MIIKKPPYPLHALCLCLLTSSVSAWAAEEKVLPTITVTGSQDSVEERHISATQKTVVGRKEIESLGGLTVGEVLGKLPGIDTGSQGGDGAAPMRARGMTRDSVQVLVDGERMGANSRIAISVVGRLPSSELERVEIIRGSSAEFGGGAPVTLNLVMRKALPKKSLSLKAALGMREDRLISQFSVSKGGGEDGFSWLWPLTLNHHETPAERDVERQNLTAGTRSLWQVDHEEGDSGFNEHVTSPRLTWKKGTDSFTLWPTVVLGIGERNSDMFRASYAIPAVGGGYAADGGRHDHEENERLMLRLRGEGEMAFGNSKLSGRLAQSRGRQATDTERINVDDLGVSTLSSERLRRHEQEGNASLRLDHALGDHLLAGSIEYTGHRRRDDQTLVASALFRAEEQVWTAWLQDEWNISNGLVLTGGVRNEAIRQEVDGVRRDANRLSPSLALRWEPRDSLVFRTSLGTGLKAPKLDELTNLPVLSLGANSPLEADRRGNPGLLPERTLNFEAVVEQFLADKTSVLGGNIYWRATENFVERRIQLEGARWVDRPRNEGDAQHYGVELDAKLRTDAWGLKGGTLRGHLTLPRSRVEDQRLGLIRPARDTPVYQFTLGHDQNLPAWKGSVGFQAQFFGRIKSKVPGELWAATNARSVLDLYALRKVSPNINLRLNLQNVLGTDTRKSEVAYNGADSWLLSSTNQGARGLLLSLEGKW